jgi:hypothetical protein
MSATSGKRGDGSTDSPDSPARRLLDEYRSRSRELLRALVVGEVVGERPGVGAPPTPRRRGPRK